MPVLHYLLQHLCFSFFTTFLFHSIEKYLH
nr:MAG TPA: hypothetical protein [Caudoviricetes sp.]